MQLNIFLDVLRDILKNLSQGHYLVQNDVTHTQKKKKTHFSAAI